MIVPDGEDPIGNDAIIEGAAAICPASHRRNADPKEPPCDACLGLSETVLRGAWPHLGRPSE